MMPLIDMGSQYTVSNISYDRQGNIETLIRNAPTTAHPTGTIVDQLTYQYSARTNRLEAVADAITTDLDWDAKPSTFQYNRVGSMTRTTETLGAGVSRVTQIQQYDERHLPEDLRIDIVSLSGGETTYVRYRYDINGQRIRKQIRETASGPDVHYERYVRDGMRLVGVFDENNSLKSWNLGGAAGLVGRADAHPMIFPPEHRYYVTDHLGSIRAVVNHSGTVIEGRDYYPYGLTMPGRFYVLSDTTREGFTGHELDQETGDYYAGARFYGPALARWFVVDPMADAYPGWSPYNYTLGNPVMFIDPDGRCSRPVGIGEGQVGICIGQFIASSRIGGIGLGDNRGPVGDDPSATYRAQFQLVVDPREGSIVSTVTDAGKSSVFVKPLGLQGEAYSETSSPVIDDHGNMHFTVTTTAINGLSLIPIAPQDSIDMIIDLIVTPDGQVGVVGGMRDSYPSLEVYQYGSDGAYRLILHLPETKPQNLASPMDEYIPTTRLD